MGGNGCVGVFRAPLIIQRCGLLLKLPMASPPGPAQLHKRVSTGALPGTASSFSFVRVAFFSSKLTPIAYPNPSQAKDKILTEAVGGGTTMGGS